LLRTTVRHPELRSNLIKSSPWKSSSQAEEVKIDFE
jgi:hypothetical protein